MIHKDPDFIQYCKTELKAFIEKTQGIQLASLSSIDGFEISTEFIDSKEISAMKLSAMGSSLLALSSGVVKEFQLEQINFLEINTDDGYIFVAPTLIDDKEFVLLIQTNDKTLQGELVYQGKNLIKNISAFRRISVDLI